MHQKTNFTFQALLKKVQKERLNIEDIYNVNRRVATELSISRLLDTVIIV